MTRSIIELETTQEDHRVARIAAAAIALALVDSAIPLPLPGIKPGLANIVTMFVLARYGWSTAAWVTGLRVVASGILLGHFLSPAFFLSVAGAVASLAVLAFAVRLPDRVFGPVTWSLFAAFAHIAGQVLLVRLWLIPGNGVFYLVPFFAAAALIFGTINGVITARLLGDTGSVREFGAQNA
ncbi:MAG: Gx transporter family protein [Candidatus Accumulibacter sp.]|jgi:heptaprenyl diphosphate synthase|nr:Gx transporter family protein [Accumulibacter sp.]